MSRRDSQIARGAPLVWDALADEAVLRQLSEDGRARCLKVRAALEAAFRVRNDTSMARWVEYCRQHSTNLIRPASGYGDWLSIKADTPKPQAETAPAATPGKSG